MAKVLIPDLKLILYRKSSNLELKLGLKSKMSLQRYKTEKSAVYNIASSSWILIPEVKLTVCYVCVFVLKWEKKPTEISLESG